MVAVHSFVAEILSDFINTLKTTYDKTFQIQLCCNSHVHILVERIKMSDEWTSGSTTCNHLQRWSFHFRITCLIENLTHGANYRCSLQERFLHSIIHNKVNITLAIAQFGIVKTIVSHTILVFHDGKWFQTLT